MRKLWQIVMLCPVAELLLAAALPQPALAAASVDDQILGVWRNPRQTVDVRTEVCGAHVCGVIVRASHEAMADAKEAGVDPLIGVNLLENCSRDGAGVWSGTLYVPDMGRRFSSRIRQFDESHLTISGCLIGNFICKSQTWSRV